MINEKQLIASYPSFWNDLCPFLSSYTLFANASAFKFCSRIVYPGERRDKHLFTVFIESLIADCSASIHQSPSELKEEVLQAIRSEPHLAENDGLRSYGEKLLNNYFSPLMIKDQKNVEWFPTIQGYGPVFPCKADLIFGVRLLEYKNVERGFSSNDIKQILTYTALSYAQGIRKIDSISILNVGRGLMHNSTLQDFTLGLAGETPESLIGKFLVQLESLMIDPDLPS